MSDLLSVIHQDNLPTTNASSRLGVRGESLAAGFIEMLGYRIVMSNFKAPIGRNSRGVQVSGEIDLIALDGETLCFIEVKTRRSADLNAPLSAVDLRKQRQITRAARVYRRFFGLTEMVQRFDVVTVVLQKGAEPQIRLTKNFWTEAKFKKPRSNGDVFPQL